MLYVLSKLKPPFNLYHYDLIILPTNVRRCYGCNCEFVDKYRQEPYNIIVKHVDRRIVQKDPVTHSYVYSPDFSNTYYHPISYHIRRKKPKNPLFSGSVRVVVKPLRIDQCFPETSVREQRLNCWLIIMYFYNVLAWIYLLFVILYGCF